MFAFTEASVAALPRATGRFDDYRDSQVAGLYLRVFTSGAKTFLVRRWVRTQTLEVKLGRFALDAVIPLGFDDDPLMVLGLNPQLTVKQARALARVVIAELHTNKHAPLPQRGRPLSFGDLFGHYLERHAKKVTKRWKRTADEFRRYFGALSDMPADTITRLDVELYHAETGHSRGHYAANRAIQLGRAVYNKAILWGLHKGENPFSRISLYPETPRDRCLSEMEVLRLLSTLEEMPPSRYGDDRGNLRDFLLLTLLTGARKSEVLSMRFSDVDTTAGKWRIQDTKNRRPMIYYLSVRELEIIARRRQVIDGEFVFPGTGKSGHLEDPKKSWPRLRQLAGLEDFNIHDLRRSLGVAMADANLNVSIIQAALNHKDLKTTLSVYARARQKAVKDARERVHNGWFQGNHSDEGETA
jgi:integrase